MNPPHAKPPARQRPVEVAYDLAWGVLISGAVLPLIGFAVVGAAVTLGATLALFLLGRSRDREQSHRIEEADARAAEATRRADDASRRAVQEEVARARLEARIAPRRVPPEQQAIIAERLRPLGSLRFWIITETNDYDRGSEQMRLAEDLASALVAAGWVRGVYPLPNPGPILPMYRRVSSRGVEVGYPASEETLLRAAHELVGGLTGAFIDSTLVAFSDISGLIVINVGLR